MLIDCIVFYWGALIKEMFSRSSPVAISGVCVRVEYLSEKL